MRHLSSSAVETTSIIVAGLVLAVTIAACGGGAGANDAVEVSGSTGLCDLPGEVLTCAIEMSDDRLDGVVEVDISCPG